MDLVGYVCRLSTDTLEAHVSFHVVRLLNERNFRSDNSQELSSYLSFQYVSN